MDILVTGGAKGIGRATVELLLEKDYEVKVIDHDSEALQQLPEPVEAYDLDVRDEWTADEVQQMELDVLVNCAGYQEQVSAQDMSMEVFENHVDTNYLGTVRMVKAALPSLKRNEGKIINISSIAGFSTTRFFGAYSASKYAVEAFSDALRMELNEFDVDVVIVEPGPIDTGFNRRAAEALQKYIPESVFSDEYRDRIEQAGNASVGPEKAAEKIVKAVEKESPRARYTVTWQAFLVSKIRLFLPTGLYDRFAKKF